MFNDSMTTYPLLLLLEYIICETLDFKKKIVDGYLKCRICCSHAEDEMEECDLHDWHHAPPLLCQIENQATIPTRFRVKEYKFLFGPFTS
jgi:hypothetical protein